MAGLMVAIANSISSNYVVSAGGGFDPNAEAFITAAGITNPTQQNAINDLVLDLKAASIWTKFNALYPIVGGTAASHKYNLKNPLDTNAAFRLTFSTGWTHTSTGMTGNGSSSYADTSLIPNSVLSLNSTHISAYTRSNILIDAPLLSSENATTYANGLYIWAKQTGAPNNSSVRINDNTSDVVAAPADIRGLHLATRTASNVKKYRLNNTQQFSVTSSSTALNTSSIYIGASRNNPNYNSSQIAFSSIGDGLTDTESQLFYQIVEKYQVALSRNINPTQSFYYNRNYNNETNAFLFATQITDTTQQTAVNTLVNDFKSAGIWSKMKAVYPIVGGTAATHAVNLSAPGTYNLTFATGITHSSTGMVGNGTTGYANTNLLPTSVLSLNSVHLSFYSRTNSIGNYAEIGASGTGAANTTYLQIDAKWSDNNFYGNANDADFTTNTVVDSLGFFAVSRTGASASKTYKNGSVVTTKNISSVALPDRNIFICARNLAVGGTSNYSTRQCAFSSIGDGLSDTEAANFYTAVQAFQTTLGRQIP